MDTLWDAVVTKEMVGLAVAAIAIMLIIGRLPIKKRMKVNDTALWKGGGSFILMFICVAGSFAPGVNDIPLKNWGSILVFGFVAAFVAHLGRAAFKPWMIKRLEDKQ
jgi:hypothetical protein